MPSCVPRAVWGWFELVADSIPMIFGCTGICSTSLCTRLPKMGLTPESRERILVAPFFSSLLDCLWSSGLSSAPKSQGRPPRA